MGQASLPAGAWWSWPHITTAGAADLSAAMKWSAVPLIMSLMLVDFFDTIGTATGIAEEAGIVEPDGTVPRLKALLAVDAFSASIGGWLGASSVTSYIESAAGVADGRAQDCTRSASASCSRPRSLRRWRRWCRRANRRPSSRLAS
jgi:AGZA family xanthine/uracil permease-like MFS transporter